MGHSALTRLASIVLGAAVGLLSVAGALASPPQVVLGKKNVFPYSQGWGTVRPRMIFNGGVPSGKAWHLEWNGWGRALLLPTA